MEAGRDRYRVCSLWFAVCSLRKWELVSIIEYPVSSIENPASSIKHQVSLNMDLSIPYHLENYIGGNLIGPLSGNFMDNINPATGEIYGQVPASNEKDVEAAVQ